LAHGERGNGEISGVEVGLIGEVAEIEDGEAGPIVRA
jgi:hypothetical protein